MRKGNKILGAFLLLTFICIAVVFAIEESTYTPNEISFDVIAGDSENTINLNTATKEELMKLEGVGEKIAERIIDFRERTRPFETIYDIKLVKGFGETLFEDNKNRIVVK